MDKVLYTLSHRRNEYHYVLDNDKTKSICNLKTLTDKDKLFTKKENDSTICKDCAIVMEVIQYDIPDIM